MGKKVLKKIEHDSKIQILKYDGEPPRRFKASGFTAFIEDKRGRLKQVIRSKQVDLVDFKKRGKKGKKIWHVVGEIRPNRFTHITLYENKKGRIKMDVYVGTERFYYYPQMHEVILLKKWLAKYKE